MFDSTSCPLVQRRRIIGQLCFYVTQSNSNNWQHSVSFNYAVDWIWNFQGLLSAGWCYGSYCTLSTSFLDLFAGRIISKTSWPPRSRGFSGVLSVYSSNPLHWHFIQSLYCKSYFLYVWRLYPDDLQPSQNAFRMWAVQYPIVPLSRNLWKLTMSRLLNIACNHETVVNNFKLFLMHRDSLLSPCINQFETWGYTLFHYSYTRKI